MRFWIWVPLGLFAALLGLVTLGLLRPAERTVASRMIGKPLPIIDLPPAAEGLPTLPRASDAPRLVNVFASWCVPCIAEAPVLADLARRGATIDGVAIRDQPSDVARFLKRHGNPYRAIGADATSRLQMAIGSSGVPETFVVDARGIIRHQHIGPVMPADVPTLLAKLEAVK